MFCSKVITKSAVGGGLRAPPARLGLTLFWGGGYFDLVFGGGGKITSPILTAVLVVQLSSNLVRISNFLSVLNFWILLIFCITGVTKLFRMLFTYSAGTFSAFSFYSIVHLIFFSLYFSPWHSFKQSLQYLPDSSLSFCGCCATRMPNTRVWGKITNYCSSAPIVFKLGQNIKLSKCFKFLEKKIKIFHFLMTSSLFFGKNIWNFLFFFFLEMRTSMFLKHFKHKTKNIKHKTNFFFLMTWLDKWQQGRTHIRHILFKFLPNLCYIKKIKVIEFGDKIFNRTKVINKNLKGEVILPPPPPPPPAKK